MSTRITFWKWAIISIILSILVSCAYQSSERMQQRNTDNLKKEIEEKLTFEQPSEYGVYLSSGGGGNARSSGKNLRYVIKNGNLVFFNAEVMLSGMYAEQYYCYQRDDIALSNYSCHCFFYYSEPTPPAKHAAIRPCGAKEVGHEEAIQMQQIVQTILPKIEEWSTIAKAVNESIACYRNKLDSTLKISEDEICFKNNHLKSYKSSKFGSGATSASESWEILELPLQEIEDQTNIMYNVNKRTDEQ